MLRLTAINIIRGTIPVITGTDIGVEIIPLIGTTRLRLNNKVTMPLVKPACRGRSIQPQPAIAAFNAEAEGVVGSETEVLTV